ncbi:SPX domain-containing protein [Boletus edulis BED1]|uniref:SPX domain-containing protein n=1 Tax=Boletus edulis BED1 TaxID=1328754 RepID=A0AAD4GFH5_BOLED|nr:SPX domain-containing protein [Boletus edulis BED1]
MKFSSALKFNAVADWWDEYIAYDVLKRHIYQLEKEYHRLSRTNIDLEANERTALVEQPDFSSIDGIFTPLLDQELQKISLFYEEKEKELFAALQTLEDLVAEQDEAGTETWEHYMDDHADEEDEDDDDDDDDEQIVGDHVRFEGEALPKGRRRKSSSVSFRPRSNSGARNTSTGHRWSISSMEHGRDLEARPSSSRPRANSASKSPMGRIAGKLMNMRDSITSLPTESVWTAKTNYAWDIRLLFKRRITNLYVSFSCLKSYVEVNHSGFRKILKKYDKVTYNELKDRYMHDIVEARLPFLQSSKDKLTAAINRLVTLYAKCVTGDDPNTAVQQLKVHQREHIAWERNTIWRQMLAQERRGASDPSDFVGGGILAREEECGIVDIPTPFGGFRLKRKRVSLIVAIAVFVVLMNTHVIKDGPEANKCFAILIFSTIMWASEAIPLFVTSTLVPFLLVVFRVIRSDGEDSVPLSTPDATKYVFSVMFSPTIMLLVGGLTIAAALSKTNIDRMLITRLLSMAGSKPRTVILAFMAVSCFASMWISNIAAPALCFTLIRPILRTLPARAPFAPCLILGIALAANIGGQSSPISSPQNLIAIGFMDPQLDWGSWFAVALPVSIISVLLIWLLLLVSYQPSRAPDGHGEIEIRAIRPTREAFTLKQYWVVVVCLVTIGLWCVEHQIEDMIGDMGIIAIIPIVAFFATGVLKKDDFEQFAWTIVFLAMGGIALGNGVKSSGLMDTMDGVIHRMLEGRTLYSVVIVLSITVLIVSTFISHTIASVLLVPIAQQVGKDLPGSHANLLIFLTGLICSTGMGMPVSGFPNQLAAAQEDDLGQAYLTNIDFLKNGIPASIIAALVVSTVGYLLMLAIGL